MHSDTAPLRARTRAGHDDIATLLRYKSAMPVALENVMKLSEYARYDAIGLAELVRDGEVSPIDLVGCAESAIDAVNPQVNAVIGRLDPAEQLASAPRHGAFYGVPFLIKDLIISAK